MIYPNRYGSSIGDTRNCDWCGSVGSGSISELSIGISPPAFYGIVREQSTGVTGSSRDSSGSGDSRDRHRSGSVGG